MICRERGTRIKQKIDAKTNNCERQNLPKTSNPETNSAEAVRKDREGERVTVRRGRNWSSERERVTV